MIRFIKALVMSIGMVMLCLSAIAIANIKTNNGDFIGFPSFVVGVASIYVYMTIQDLEDGDR